MSNWCGWSRCQCVSCDQLWSFKSREDAWLRPGHKTKQRHAAPSEGAVTLAGAFLYLFCGPIVCQLVTCFRFNLPCNQIGLVSLVSLGRLAWSPFEMMVNVSMRSFRVGENIKTFVTAWMSNKPKSKFSLVVEIQNKFEFVCKEFSLYMYVKTKKHISRYCDDTPNKTRKMVKLGQTWW